MSEVARRQSTARLHRLSALVDEIERGGHGLVMCMGKGGVGKTTIAASIAVALAHRGHQVHLTTTDPAAHVEETLHGAVEGLRVSRIDPVEATREYRDRIMATKGKNLDDAGRAALHEDLLSPCTEEVAVFGQFSRVISAVTARVRGRGHRAHRPHAAAARRGRVLPPRHRPADGFECWRSAPR